MQGKTLQSQGTAVTGFGYSEQRDCDKSEPSKIRRHATLRTCMGPVGQAMQSLKEPATHAAPADESMKFPRIFARDDLRSFCNFICTSRCTSSLVCFISKPCSSPPFMVSTFCLCCRSIREFAAQAPAPSIHPSAREPFASVAKRHPETRTFKGFMNLPRLASMPI